VDLNPELGEYFSASRGALILDVDEDVELDVRPGDVIQDVDGRAVEDSGDLRRILRSYERDEPISFNLVRKGETVTVEGRWREGD
jgi:S1-C subfamily serine protease